MNTEAKSKPRIQRITSKGQITLPIAWRRKVKTDMIMVYEIKNEIKISPAKTYKMTPEDRDDDIIIFNADRDNDGKGVPIEKVIRILEKLEREDQKKKRKK